MDISVTIRVADWLAYPPRRWNMGLRRAGLAWTKTLQQYPPAPPREGLRGLYTRTGTLGNKATAAIVTEGKTLELRGVKYVRYALDGVGIYGPSGQPIRPKKGKFLAIPVHGTLVGQLASIQTVSGLHTRKGQLQKWHKRDQGLIFVREVRGYKWEGKKEEVIQAMKDAFLEGVRQDYREFDFGGPNG